MIRELNIVTCSENCDPQVASPGQPLWKFLGSRFAEAHIHGKAQARGTEFVEIGISFTVLP
jgi:hypothetical protein